MSAMYCIYNGPITGTQCEASVLNDGSPNRISMEKQFGELQKEFSVAEPSSGPFEELFLHTYCTISYPGLKLELDLIESVRYELN